MGDFSIADGDGPIRSYKVRLEIGKSYPDAEPKLYEVGGELGPPGTRHVNGDGSCCFGVWECWLLTTSDTSVSAMLSGPVFNYFLSQFLFDATGRWPFGELSHGTPGEVEAAARVLGCAPSADEVGPLLDALINDKLEENVPCPCGSRKTFKGCHLDKLLELSRSAKKAWLCRLAERIAPARASLSWSNEALQSARALIRQMRDYN